MAIVSLSPSSVTRINLNWMRKFFFGSVVAINVVCLRRRHDPTSACYRKATLSVFISWNDGNSNSGAMKSQIDVSECVRACGFKRLAKKGKWNAVGMTGELIAICDFCGMVVDIYFRT